MRKGYEPPSQPTLRRVLNQIDPDALKHAFPTWIQANMPADDGLVVFIG